MQLKLKLQKTSGKTYLEAKKTINHVPYNILRRFQGRRKVRLRF